MAYFYISFVFSFGERIAQQKCRSLTVFKQGLLNCFIAVMLFFVNACITVLLYCFVLFLFQRYTVHITRHYTNTCLCDEVDLLMLRTYCMRAKTAVLKRIFERFIGPVCVLHKTSTLRIGAAVVMATTPLLFALVDSEIKNFF